MILFRLLITALILAAAVWLIVRAARWARRVDLKIGLHRMPTQKEMTILAVIGQAMRFLVRLLLRR